MSTGGGSQASAPLLDVSGLTTRFLTRRGAVQAVNDVSLRIHPGEIVGIVGESGCGKSATLRSILGLIEPPGRVVSGDVLFEGRDLLRLPRRELRRIRGDEIGFIAQNPFASLNPILPIEKQFRNLIKSHRRATYGAMRDVPLRMLEAVGIPGPNRVLNGYSHELSGGMSQRVVLAMALSLDPKLLVADEPTTALDVTTQRQFLDLVHQLVSDEGRAMLLVTHDLGVVAHYCHRIFVMYAGKVVEWGPVNEVFTNPAHPYTLALLGAVPRPGQELMPLGGRVPDLIDYPTGCPFRTRCEFAFDRCEHDEPELLPPSNSETGTRRVACHLPAEEVRRSGASASRRSA